MKQATFIKSFSAIRPSLTIEYPEGYSGMVEDDIYSLALIDGAIEKEEVKNVRRPIKAK